MQAVGMVNDHLVDCFRYREIQHGAPEKALTMVKRQFKSEELGTDTGISRLRRYSSIVGLNDD